MGARIDLLFATPWALLGASNAPILRILVMSCALAADVSERLAAVVKMMADVRLDVGFINIILFILSGQ